jgi:hypothetical protein
MSASIETRPSRCKHTECKCCTDNISGYCSIYCMDAQAAAGDKQELCRCGHIGCDPMAVVAAAVD